ncbi:ABC-2 type transport system permease protein [Natranaerovirga pectinivora]|uniref:Transport permease protein n=1 Tax=Natranaerovirga pectinivora TaxID=682400 RepID=A0A4R3MLJ7_9FIRM|nr:ABC transporter permease [Natranaerovirga pectinivora]TCT14557.1 ABC-2 type transport system permease protein [Natranaerovirga pectinivora]
MFSLIKRIIKQVKNDKRSLALMLFAPLMILTLINLLLGDTSYTPKIAIVEGPAAIIEALSGKDTNIAVIGENINKEEFLKKGNADAILTIDKEGIQILMYEPSSVKTELVVNVTTEALGGLESKAPMEVGFIVGKVGLSSFNSMGYIFLGILSFFFVFLIAGISFVRERTTGTLERLMITSIKRREVIGGYTIGFGIFAALQSVMITLFVKYVLKIEFNGSVALTSIIMILLAIAAVSIGAFASIFANNEFQIIQFVPVVILPQVFLSGLIPIDTIPYNLGKLAYITPIYYGCSAIKQVLLYGKGIGDILFYISMQIFFVILFYLINTMALKRYRLL